MEPDNLPSKVPTIMKPLCSIIIAFLVASLPLPAQDVSRPALSGAAQTKTFPYSMVGQIIFGSGDSDYQGSGTVVQKHSVLTAAHNVWDVDNGWSYNVDFNRARVGTEITQATTASKLFIFGGYQGQATRYGADSLRAFANDLGGLRFRTLPGAGSFAGWKAAPDLVTGDSYNICLGYGADTHTGDDLLFVEPGLSFYKTFSAFYENDSLTFEGGMSGGPVFAELKPGDLRIVGVIVAGSDTPPSGGIRVLNANGALFISTYLNK